jgi:hypothetical protein
VSISRSSFVSLGLPAGTEQGASSGYAGPVSRFASSESVTTTDANSRGVFTAAKDAARPVFGLGNNN